ncbi:hypothetical protein [Orenia metallireducens]|jgi:hypothetical protein|nr:hypothetical protein [Orenia metallireducens]
MEWLKNLGLILGLIFTFEKIILTALEIIKKYKELNSDDES